MLTNEQKQILKQTAHDSIEHGLKYNTAIDIDVRSYPKTLCEVQACFVTLSIDDKLRGCIGTLEAHRPLIIDVAKNAFSAAFRDPRFAPLSDSEFTKTDIHISVLNPPESMTVKDEADLYAQLRPGIDGVVLEEGMHRSTFLPSVWETLTTPEEFMQQLKLKAGIPINHWSNNMSFERYTVEEI